jgi:hypothetical protein
MEHQHQLPDNRSIGFRSIVALSLALLLFSINSMPAQTPVLRFANQVGGSGFSPSYAIAVDTGGNSYITGYIEGTVDFDPGPDTAYLGRDGETTGYMAKYDSAGEYLWAFRLGIAGHALAISGSGNVVVRGTFAGTLDFDPGDDTANLTAETNELFVAQYTPAGNYLWAWHIPVPASKIPSQATYVGLAIDESGDIVVSGAFNDTVDFDPGTGEAYLSPAFSSQGNPDMFVAKYSATGKYVWAFHVGGSEWEQADAVAIDRKGNIYLTGYFRGTVNFNPGGGAVANLSSSGGSPDIFVAKYSASQEFRWVFSVGGVTNDRGLRLAVNGDTTVVIAGYFSGIAYFDPGSGSASLTALSSQDIFVASYDSSGNFRWVAGPGRGWSKAVAIDRSGDIVIGGSFYGTNDFDPGPGVANLTSVPDTVLNGFVASYAPSGKLRWAFDIPVSANYSHVTGLATGSAGNVYVIGAIGATADLDPGNDTVYRTPTGKSANFLARYSSVTQPNLSAGESSDNSHDIDLRVVPNPFTDAFTLHFDVASSPSRIQIVDVMGRVVESRAIIDSNDEITFGSTLPAGAYFIEIVQGRERRRIMIHKVK